MARKEITQRTKDTFTETERATGGNFLSKWGFEILEIEKEISNSESRIEISYARYPEEIERGWGLESFGTNR